jgi:hypothetical protein
MSDVSINIVSQFLGQKAFDKAGNSANKLATNVKRALIGVGFEEFARRSINAFAANEKEMAGLSKTLKNLGLQMQDASVASYLDKLALATGALKSELVPAFQTLALATKDTADATTLLNLAMDISAGSTNSLDSVISALSKAYKGNVAGLGKLNVGIDKTMLATGDLQEIVAYLTKTFSGQAKTAAETYANRVLRIKTAIEDAQEAIGKGLVDSITILTGSQNIEELQTKIINFGTEAGEVFRKLAGLLKENETALKNIAALLAGLFIGSKITAGIYVFIGAMEAINTTMKILRGTAIGTAIATMAVLNPLGAVAYGVMLVGVIAGTIKAVDLLADSYDKAAKKSKSMGKNPIQSGTYLATTKKLVNYTKVLTAEELKQLKAKQLKLAIDKANIALGKGTDVFDLDKIQLNAALIGQAEALGKATTGSQILAIANDVQRLKIKQDIAVLEDAIASKDEAAILKATAKLNEDLKILGALQKQDAKLLDINKVLAGMKSTDLINLSNLQAALDLLAKFKFPTLTMPGVVMPGAGVGGRGGNAGKGSTFGTSPLDDFLTIVEAETERGGRRAGGIGDTNYMALPPGFSSVDEYLKESRGNRGASDAGTIIVNVNAGAVGDENIIVDAVQNALNEISRRGYTTTYAGAIAV